MPKKYPVPAKPELAVTTNKQRVIRYPFKTGKGTSVVRTYKLGWIKDDEANQQFKAFTIQWHKLQGDAKAVVEAMGGTPPRLRGGLPAVIEEKQFKLSEEHRAKAREAYHRKKNGGNGTAALGTANDNINDLIGMMVANLNAVTLTLKLLQERLSSTQR